MLGVLPTRDHGILIDIVLDVKEDLLHLALGLCRDRGAIDRLDDAVETIFARQGPVFGRDRFQHGRLSRLERQGEQGTQADESVFELHGGNLWYIRIFLY